MQKKTGLNELKMNDDVKNKIFLEFREEKQDIDVVWTVGLFNKSSTF